jgi:starch synthase
MRVLFVAAEAYPLAKTGGLGDVGAALPAALADRGADVRLLLPGYPQALKALVGGRVEARIGELLGVPDGRLVSGWLPGSGVRTWLIDAPSLYQRPGGPYADADGREWADNALRFSYLSHVGALLALGMAAYWKADVVHANDWHTGLLPMILGRAGPRRPRTVFTIHNLAFQGNVPFETARAVGVPEAALTIDGCEFYGRASFMKAGIRYADRITTVSPTYAREILGPELGCGMDGLLRSRAADLRGVLNGVSCDQWSPAVDPCLPASFSARDISGKRACKAALQRELGLPVDPERPLLGFISRLTHQKMADVLVQVLPWLAAQGAQFVQVGDGCPELSAAFVEAGRRLPESVAARIGYQEPLAHRVCAGADILLAPARFEPCGLTQLYGMRYGAIPVVRRTGGLADTVVDANRRTLVSGAATGFVFEEPTAAGLTKAIRRALRAWREPLAWRRLQRQAMAQDFSWDDSAGRYLDLYGEITGLAAPARPRIPSVDTVSEAVRA